MIIKSEQGSLTLTREASDPRMSSDSQLLYHLKNALNKALGKTTGKDSFIKVRMAKDGHMVDDLQQYVCTRNREWMIYQGDYAIRDLYHDFNAGESVTLTVQGNVGNTLTIPGKSLAEKLDPRPLGYSPKMSTIIGAILGHDYGVSGGHIGTLTGEFSVTSDGFVIASCTGHESGAFFGGITEFEQNIQRLLKDANLNEKERKEFDALYAQHVHKF